MSIEEIFKAVRANEVTAPVGTKTFFCIAVDPEGKIDMAGTADPNHAVQIAYLLMRNVFEPRKEAESNGTEN